MGEVLHLVSQGEELDSKPPDGPVIELPCFNRLPDLSRENHRLSEARTTVNLARRELDIVAQQINQLTIELGARRANLDQADYDLMVATKAVAEAKLEAKTAAEIEQLKTARLQRCLAAAGFDKPGQPFPDMSPLLGALADPMPGASLAS